jgi:hypothetical protein
MKKVFALVGGKIVPVLGTIAATVRVAGAAAQDYSDIGTSAAAEVTAVMPEALTLFGLIFGVPLAIKLLRRIAR